MIAVTDEELRSVARLFRDSRTVVTVSAFIVGAIKHRRTLTEAQIALADQLMTSVAYDLDDLERIGSLLERHGERS